MIGSKLFFSCALSLILSSWIFAAPNSFEDSRDFKTYRTISYGPHTWFAENLQFSSSSIKVFEKKGTFYPKEDLASICPDSYRVPTLTDWATLEETLSGAQMRVLLKKFVGKGALGYYQIDASKKNIEVGKPFAYFQVGSDSKNAMEIDLKKGKMRMVELPPQSLVATRCVKDRDLLAEKGIQNSKFTDSRNGKSYAVLLQGKKLWMTENLAYDFPQKGEKGNANDTLVSSNCYLEDQKFCKEFGRYYTWMETKKACPSGWHLPGDAEWRDFQKEPENVNWKQIGRGGCHNWDSYCDFDNTAFYWSASTVRKGTARGWEFRKSSRIVNREDQDQKMGMYVRCVMDLE